jgi:hypothetical protein
MDAAEGLLGVSQAVEQKADPLDAGEDAEASSGVESLQCPA